jgi:Right handed beta helix region
MSNLPHLQTRQVKALLGMKKLLSLGLSLALALAWLGFNNIPLAQAASFIVNDTSNDLPDANLLDGVCQTVTPGDCTLRAAIMQANALNGDDTITLPASVIVLNLTGVAEDLSALGDLDITSNMTINGASATTTMIDGSGLVTERVFQILSGNVTISNVTIQGGHAGSENGGGVLVSGGSLNLTNTKVTNNSATSGGGVAITGGSLTVNFSTIGSDTGPSPNTASNNGGGLFVGGNANTTVNNSTFSFNQAKAGGGVYVSNGSTVTLNNSTISSNSVTGTDVTDGGGGLFAAGTANLNSVTVANNTVNGTGAGGGLLQLGGTINVRNTIIADNINPASSPDCSGTLTSRGYNLLENNAGCNGLANNVNGDIVVVSINPSTTFALDGLNNNGGSTRTHAISNGVGSTSVLAIDRGNPGGCNDGGSNFNTDQRGPGFSRTQNFHCDIGAFEYIFTVGDAPTTTPTFTPIPSLTFTPSSTSTPAPSNTPAPTATNTLLPTSTGTLTPSATPAPKIPLFTSAPPTSDFSGTQTALAQFAPTMAALTAAAAVPTFTPDVAQTMTAFAIANATSTPTETPTATPTLGPTFAFPSETGVLAVSESVGRGGGQFACGVFLLTASSGTVPEDSHFQCNTVASDNTTVPVLPSGTRGFWQTAEIKITGSNGLPIESFTQPLLLCAYYSDSYSASVGGDPSRFTIYTSSPGGEWQALNTAPDPNAPRVCAPIDHFSYFRLAGQPAPLTLPGGVGSSLSTGVVGAVAIAAGVLLLVVVLIVVIVVVRRRKPAPEEA